MSRMSVPHYRLYLSLPILVLCLSCAHMGNESALRRVGLGCIPRGGHHCDQEGFGCLVMFPDTQWSSMRERYGNAPALDGIAEIRLGEQPRLYYEFRSAPPASMKTIPVYNDVSLEDSVAARLGLRSMSILQGRYDIEPQMGKFGGVVFNLKVDPTVMAITVVKPCGWFCRFWGFKVENIGCSTAPDGQSHSDTFITTRYRLWKVRDYSSSDSVSGGPCP